MATTGIIIERDSSGAASVAHIDLKKYGKALAPFFEKIGVEIEEMPYDSEFVAKRNALQNAVVRKICDIPDSCFHNYAFFV